MSTANKDLPQALEWPYNTALIYVPILLISGAGGGSDRVATGDGLAAIYDDICCRGRLSFSRGDIFSLLGTLERLKIFQQGFRTIPAEQIQPTQGILRSNGLSCKRVQQLPIGVQQLGAV